MIVFSLILAAIAVLVYVAVQVWFALLSIGFKLAAEQARRNNRVFARHHAIALTPMGGPITFTRGERFLIALFRIPRS